MGRPSKLTDNQWEQLGLRLAKGEKPSDLAREYKVSPTAISNRFSKKLKTVKAVANQIVDAEAALAALPVSEQIKALTIVSDLRAISTHLAGAGKYGAATAHRLSGIAHAKVQEIDDAAPLTDDSRNALRDVMVLTDMANKASTIPLNLLAANRDAVKKINEDQPEESDVLTPERLKEGVRRIAFALHRADSVETTQ